MNSNSNIHFLIYVGLVIFFPISFSLTDVTVTLICSYSYLKSLTDDVFECFLFFMCRQFSLTIDGGKCDRCVRRKMFSTCAENRTNHTNQAKWKHTVVCFHFAEQINDDDDDDDDVLKM